MVEAHATAKYIRTSAQKAGLVLDLIRGKDGPLILEVNSSPGLKGIEYATQTDVAGLIIQFIEKHARPYHTRTRGKG